MEMMYEGGFTMWVILALLLPLVGFAVVHAVLAARWSAVTVFAVLGAIFAVGLVGRTIGRSKTDEAIAMVDADMADRLREVGYAESSRPIDLAVLAACAAALPIAVGETRRLTRPRARRAA
jgi:hypothetical protein